MLAGDSRPRAGPWREGPSPTPRGAPRPAAQARGLAESIQAGNNCQILPEERARPPRRQPLFRERIEPRAPCGNTRPEGRKRLRRPAFGLAPALQLTLG